MCSGYQNESKTVDLNGNTKRPRKHLNKRETFAAARYLEVKDAFPNQFFIERCKRLIGASMTMVTIDLI